MTAPLSWLCISCKVNYVVAKRQGNLDKSKYCSQRCRWIEHNRRVRERRVAEGLSKYRKRGQPDEPAVVLTERDLRDFTPEQIEARYRRAVAEKRQQRARRAA